MTIPYPFAREAEELEQKVEDLERTIARLRRQVEIFEWSERRLLEDKQAGRNPAAVTPRMATVMLDLVVPGRFADPYERHVALVIQAWLAKVVGDAELEAAAVAELKVVVAAERKAAAAKASHGPRLGFRVGRPRPAPSRPTTMLTFTALDRSPGCPAIAVVQVEPGEVRLVDSPDLIGLLPVERVKLMLMGAEALLAQAEKLKSEVFLARAGRSLDA